VPDVSLATVVTGIGVALALAGSAFGVWLVLIGAGVVVLGLSGIVKERTGT
jgi:mannose/fructose/N-acetylgalactosamine-specific phosphotransferase system component IID